MRKLCRDAFETSCTALGIFCLGGAWLCFRAIGRADAAGVFATAFEPRRWDVEAERLFDEQ